MAKVLFFNFDGTDNEPADAVQDKNFLGIAEDDSITNVLKFHLLLGGTLQQKTGHTLLPSGSRTFYYNGVGTYGNFFWYWAVSMFFTSLTGGLYWPWAEAARWRLGAEKTRLGAGAALRALPHAASPARSAV